MVKRNKPDMRADGIDPAVTAILTEVGLLRHSTPPSMWTKSLLKLFQLFDAYERERQTEFPTTRPARRRPSAATRSTRQHGRRPPDQRFAGHGIVGRRPW